MIYFIIILLVIIIILFGFHIYKHVSFPINNEILQIGTYDKELLEKHILQKQPIVIMNTLTEIDLFEKLYLDELEKRDVKLYFNDTINKDDNVLLSIKKSENKFIYESRKDADIILTDEYYTFIKNLQNNITIWSYNTLTLFKKEMVSPIIKCGFHRNLYLLFDGEVVFTIYPPKYNDYLYPGSKTDIYTMSKIHPKTIEQSMVEYPLYKKAFSIDIILRPGQILNIPPYWWYSIECKKDCVLIGNKSDTIFTRILNIL